MKDVKFELLNGTVQDLLDVRKAIDEGKMFPSLSDHDKEVLDKAIERQIEIRDGYLKGIYW